MRQRWLDEGHEMQGAVTKVTSSSLRNQKKKLMLMFSA
jgi:hypothetical protein